MPYYPTQTFIIGLTTIRRERRLPPGAYGEISVRELQRVEAQDIVMRAAMSGDYIILDVLGPLGLKSVDEFTEDMMQAPVGQTVERGQVIAQNKPGRGAKVLRAPAAAVIARIEGSQIILQLDPQPLEVYAMCPGTITSIRGDNEVLLETTGALIQCAWGNNQRTFCPYRIEPDDGLENMDDDDHALSMSEYRNGAMVLRKPIESAAVFRKAVSQELTGLIAPSMRSDLREAALRQNFPIILTEGFGELQMSDLVYNLLRDNLGRPAMLDATEPQRWSVSRPEIVIPLPTGGTMPPAPVTEQELVEGALVRMVRDPYAGMSGRVKRISFTPHAVENGLRFPGAEVQLSNGRTVYVPLANLEMLGRPVDTMGGM